MEIRCEKCGHLGPAASVEPIEGGVGLVCGSCGHVNAIAMASTSVASKEGSLSTDGAATEESGKDSNKALRVEASAETVTEKEGSRRKAQNLKGLGKEQEKAREDTDKARRAELLLRLLPVPGEGLRCPKCSALVDAYDENCHRCGLTLERGRKYSLKEAPWEAPLPGKEDLYDQAWLLWESAVERESATELQDFIEFTLAEGLIDFGIRRLQGYLVNHTDDEIAREGLVTLAMRLDKAFQVARTQAEASAENFSGDLKRFRKRLLFGTLIFWVFILVLLSFAFWDRF